MGYLFCLELELFAKILKSPGFHTLTETRFINNARYKQNKKDPTYPFVDFGKTETCAKFQQKILYSAAVRACQSFQFFSQITWKSGLPKFTHWIFASVKDTLKAYH